MANLVDELASFFEDSDSPVAFCGAGVGVKAGLPSWVALMNTLAEKIDDRDPLTGQQIKSCILEGDLESAADYYFMSRRVPTSELYGNFSNLLNQYDSNALLGLISLPFRAFITTNYDKSLHDAFSSHYGKSAMEVHYGDPVLSEALFFDCHYIARIHGRAETPRQVVLTRESLRRAAADETYQSFLIHHLTRSQVLFIGYSFLDPAIRTVMRSLRDQIPTIHQGRHIALLPDGADPDLAQLFQDFSITVQTYSGSDGHSELWQALDTLFKSGGTPQTTSKKGNQGHKSYQVAKRFLATCYARAKITSRIEPLHTSVLEGVLVGLLEHEYPSGLTEDEVVNSLSTTFPMPLDYSKKVTSDCLARLRKGNIIEKSGSRYFAKEDNDREHDALTQSIAKLIQGVANRAKVRENTELNQSELDYTQKLMNEIILKRGWDLGAAFASRRIPEDLDVMAIANKVPLDRQAGKIRKQRIVSALESLFREPEKDETELLVDIGRTSFALELVSQAPRSDYFLGAALPQKIYLDANVLMPAIVPYHPLNSLYEELLNKLISASRDGGSELKVLVFSGFLNEIISHLHNAKSLTRGRKFDSEQGIDRRKFFLGYENMNVFVGAYLSFLSVKEHTSFDQFLNRHAPYSTEAQLKRFLESKGFTIIGDASLYHEDSIYPKLYSWLERKYAKQIERERKSGPVLEHDAKQLALLSEDANSGTRALLVTADRGLRKFIGDDRYSDLANLMMSHVGLAQFVDLLIGKVEQTRSMAELVWGTTTSSAAEQIRNRFINLALKEHDVAFLKPMHDLVDELSEDLAMELERRELELGSNDLSVQDEVDSIFTEFENRFFDGMRREIERRNQ